MSSVGARTQRSVVDTIAQRGYDKVHSLEKRRKLLQLRKNRTCSLKDCKVKLSIYNDTDFCSSHQRGNVDPPKFL